MVSLAFYGGVNEIGGNKILLKDKDFKLMLDFGMSFSKHKMFFDEFLRPRKTAGLGDMLSLGLLPDIKGLYREDYLKHMNRKPEERSIDAIFLSHAHADHANYIHYVREDIPIICTKETYLILKALQNTGSGDVEYVETFPAFEFYVNSKGKLSKLKRNVKGAKSKIKKRKFIILNSGETVEIKGHKIKLLRVDHSLPGAAGCIVETTKGKLAYTGDLRFHGKRSELTERFVEVCKKEKPKYFLCEGTRIDEEQPNTEEDIKNQAAELVKKVKGLVVASIPVRDIDRISTFVEVAKETGRIFTVNLRQAFLLKLLEEENVEAPRLNNKNLKIYIPLKGWGLYMRQDLDEDLRFQDYKKWERDFFKHNNIATASEIAGNPSKYIFQCNIFEFTHLLDVKPDKTGCYIRSSTEPFDTEMELDEQRLKNWLRHFGLGKINQMHAGGHASGSEIKKMLETIKPEILIPIHTVHPRLFRKRIQLNKVKYPKPNKEMRL